ncbi:MAG TPA: hypothetical protein VKH41_15830 [Myxococcota bacterium]|nr:hypothetical protein [Myxococcota bacterium]
MRAARPRALYALVFAVHAAFAASVFARLGAPLLWEDEAETAIHGRSVLEYGVPKVHVGRNIVYGAPLPLSLGADEKLDAYLGSPWGQYLFAAPAVAWSDGGRDLAARTWRMRVPFALAGWLGVLLVGAVGASLWPAAAGSRAVFWLGFGVCLLLSVSLQLHLREVRYYPLVVLALGAAARLELRHHARGDLPQLRHALLLAPVLFVLFNLFYPAFTAVVVAAAAALALAAARDRAPLRDRAIVLARSAAPYALACAAALPIAVLFGLPAQSRHFFATFDSPLSAFSHQLASGALYLLRYEFAAPVLVGAAALALARRRVGPDAPELCAALTACDLVVALAAIWWMTIA